MEGEPVPISDGVAIGGLGLAHFTVSGTGILISGSTSLGRRRMQWRSRDGKVMGDIGPADTYYSPRLSPDGRRLAMARVSTAVNSDVWVYEFERGIMTRLTIAPGVDNYPAWSPDGRFVAFTTARGGPRSLFLTDAAGDRREERLTNGTLNHELLDWSSDNRYLLYREYNPVSHSDLYLLNMKSSPTGREALPFLVTPFDEIQGQFSPDARWVVYISNETGDFQLYVRPVSKGEPMPVSSQGATNPRWRRDGKEIFFISPSGMLMGVDVVEVDGRLRFSAPRELFPIPHRPGQASIDYDVTADGKRFLLLAPAAESAAAALTVSLNWQSGLKK
jgi:Tol biopolymer transport system component